MLKSEITAEKGGEGLGLETDHHPTLQDNMAVEIVMVVHSINEKMMIIIRGEMMTQEKEAMEIVIEVIKEEGVMIGQMPEAIRNLEVVNVISVVKRDTLQENVLRVAEMMTEEEMVVTSEDRMTIHGEMMTAGVDMRGVHSVISEVYV